MTGMNREKAIEAAASAVFGSKRPSWRAIRSARRFIDAYEAELSRQCYVRVPKLRTGFGFPTAPKWGYGPTHERPCQTFWIVHPQGWFYGIVNAEVWAQQLVDYLNASMDDREETP